MTAVLLDLFGTLVTYSASRTEQGYPRAAEVLERAGCRHPYDDWLRIWASTCEALDLEAEATGVEFSMVEAFRIGAVELGVDPDDQVLAAEFLGRYLEEWSMPIRPVEGVAPMLERLGRDGHQRVLVSNTHDAGLVRRQLDRMDVLDHLDAVITSVELGLRKPRPEIYAAALASVGAAAGDAVFVGDTYLADFVGPMQAGIDAYLIVGPDAEPPGPVPDDRRLRSVLDIEARIT